MNSLVPAMLDVPSTQCGDVISTPMAGGDATLAPAELMIVDDDEVALARLKLIAENAGYEVRTARDGIEAISSLKQRFCPLVMTDVMMPQMDGLSLCQEIRNAPLDGYVYTIILSVRDESKDVVTGLAAGADDYISKRATRSEVLARLMTGRRVVGLERALRRAVRENQQLTQFDPLTGCFNRHYLMHMLGREIARCRRYGHWVSVLLCDLDHFGEVNTLHGHSVGDEVLQAAAACIGTAVADSAAWIARYEGDAFAVILPETALERACEEAERIRYALARTPITTGRLSITTSIGLTGVGPIELRHELSVMQLLNAAEQCLHEGKTMGRDIVMARALHRGADVSRLPTKAK